MTAASMPTPAEFAAIDTLIAIGLIAAMAGLGWAIGWAWRGWEKAARDIDEAVSLVCKLCSYHDQTAKCTCTGRGCTALQCERRTEARR
jgi:Flp pilus assembly pilin Flp